MNAAGADGGGDVGPKFSELERAIAERALAPDPPNLKGTALARDDHHPKPIDLALFDRLDPVRTIPSHDD
jgi:hypothetical protein